MKNTDTAGLKGYDAGKKVSGIKRHIAVDTQGLPHAIAVTTAEVKVMPKCWIVERSFAWLEKNCERWLNTSLQFVNLAFLALLLQETLNTF